MQDKNPMDLFKQEAPKVKAVFESPNVTDDIRWMLNECQ